MKKQFRIVFMHYFRDALLQARGERTQEQIAAQLDISVRAYQRLEAGISCCSLYTFWMFFQYVCPDRKAFLTGIFNLIDSKGENLTQTAVA